MQVVTEIGSYPSLVSHCRQASDSHYSPDFSHVDQVLLTTSMLDFHYRTSFVSCHRAVWCSLRLGLSRQIGYPPQSSAGKEFLKRQQKRLQDYWNQIPVTYKLAANTMSRLIALDATSIFLYSTEFPIIEAAFLNSLHVSSSRTIVLTMSPSDTSVSSHMSANGVPFAHS